MTSAPVARHASRRIAVAMSGGVDSSVAAYLLSQRLQQTTSTEHTPRLMGLHMSNWNHLDDDSIFSCHEKDMNDAQKVCDALHIPMHRASFAAEYWTGVFEPFLDELSRGQTPNPDIRCNSIVKFGAMKEYARCRLGIETIATGHYARLWERHHHYKGSRPPEVPEAVQDVLDCDMGLAEWLPRYGTDPTTPLLLSAVDKNKDQSYFLSGVDGNAFRNVLFPLGDFHKNRKQQLNEDTDSLPTVRQLAKEAHLPTANKRDSTGICFIGKRNFGHFISQYVDQDTPGDFCDVDTGAIVAGHEGTLGYTIGQGARISGASQKWFVVSKELSKHIVWVCAGPKHPALYSKELYIQSLHWIAGTEPLPLRQTGRMRAQCRTRHLVPLVDCELVAPRTSGEQWMIRFDRPVRAITPGQIAALYVGDGLVCLGGGPVSERGLSYHDQGLPLPSDIQPQRHCDLSLDEATA